VASGDLEPGDLPAPSGRRAAEHVSSLPLVSLVVPVYKVEPYLRRCLDSLVAQDYRRLEVIVVNDGSPDNCGAIIAEYEQRYPRLFRVITQENQGLGAARNAGIALARGEYLGFVDSDDWVEPDFVSALVWTAAYRAADVAICNFFLDLPSGLRVPFVMLTSRRQLTGAEASQKCLDLLTIPTFAWNKLYRRELFDRVRYPSIRYEDVATAAPVLSRAQRVAVTHRPLYHYCLRRSGITGSFNARNATDYVHAVSLIRDFLWDEGLWDEWGSDYRSFLRRVRAQIVVSLGVRRSLPLSERRRVIMHVYRDMKRLQHPPARPPQPSGAPIPGHERA